HDERQDTAQNPSQTVGAGGGRADQTPSRPVAESPLAGHDEMGDKGLGGDQYDDDGLLAQQTPGLDPEPIRRDAGPDWPAGEEGDVEAETSPPGGSGAGSSNAGSKANG
ncbi:MAG TPA: hypothetical protein VFI28_08350, partial [Candidatus Limnocylindrales bacterium]|nr:hypothetical protein [Candidatus Limnocylindrales bacterium]